MIWKDLIFADLRCHLTLYMPGWLGLEPRPLSEANLGSLKEGTIEKWWVGWDSNPGPPD